MNPQRRRRLLFVLVIVGGVGLAAWLAVSAFKENLLYFYSPSQVIAGEAPKQVAFRVGGLVTNGSLRREADGLTVNFVVTDTVASVPVRYKGILPDLFREGQGIVAMGRIGKDGTFVADQVLAKHDENYMPPEVKDALQKAGAPHGLVTETLEQ